MEKDLGADFVSLLEFKLDLEKEFRKSFDDEFDELRTLGEVTDFIASKI